MFLKFLILIRKRGGKNGGKERKRKKGEKREKMKNDKRGKSLKKWITDPTDTVASSGTAGGAGWPLRNAPYRNFYPMCNLFFRIAYSPEKVLERFYRFKSITTLTVADYK